MNSKTPTIRLRSWISIIPHVIIMLIFILLWQSFFPKNGILFAAINYLILSQLLRRLIPKEHRKGIKKNNNRQFEAAIPHFENSYSFFSKNNWIDKYRFITLLSSSKLSYKEMALNNIAFCYGQTGNGVKSKEYYNKTLKEFPDSMMAKTALNMIDAFEKKESH